MNKIQIVLGSLFGDEGKGATVQYLCQEKINKGIVPLVIRFSGGPQAGHRVMHNGIDHVCSLLGSGVLLGCPTYLHKDVMIDPISLMNEIKSLQQFGINPQVFVHPYCRVIYPDDIYRNQNNNKTKKDGTCGCGIYECFKRNLEHPDIFSSIACAMVDPKDYVKLFGVKRNTEEFIKACKWLDNYCHVRRLDEIEDNYSSLIFEGSQGLLLDMENGFMPNCTPSKVGLNGVPEEYLQNAEVFLVMRSYLTRHGNGYNPVGEDFVRKYFRNLEEPTNLDNGPQGQFKIGVLDLDLVIRSFDRNHLDNYQRMYNIEYNVVITHMDCSPYPEVIPAFFNFNKIDYIDIDKAMAHCFRYISLKNTYLGLGPESEIVLFNR
jgi:adenylosuccinate synthase